VGGNEDDEDGDVEDEGYVWEVEQTSVRIGSGVEEYLRRGLQPAKS
jgi:hypothetical protein